MYDVLLKKSAAKEQNLINPIEQNVTPIVQHNELMLSSDSHNKQPQLRKRRSSSIPNRASKSLQEPAPEFTIKIIEPHIKRRRMVEHDMRKGKPDFSEMLTSSVFDQGSAAIESK